MAEVQITPVVGSFWLTINVREHGAHRGRAVGDRIG